MTEKKLNCSTCIEYDEGFCVLKNKPVDGDPEQQGCSKWEGEENESV